MITKKLFLVILFFISACQSYDIHGVVKNKIFVDSWTEIIPPGYRMDCGVTIELKLECGFKFFITSKDVYHPPVYELIILENSTEKEVTLNVNKDVWDKYQIGDTYP